MRGSMVVCSPHSIFLLGMEGGFSLCALDVLVNSRGFGDTVMPSEKRFVSFPSSAAHRMKQQEEWGAICHTVFDS